MALKVGIVGLGALGEKYIDFLSSSNNDAKLVAICGSRLARLKELSTKYSIENYYNNYDDMLNSSKLDAVIVSSNSNMHAEHIGKAIKYGVNVLSEKPIATNLVDAQRLKDIVDNTPKNFLMVSFQRRSSEAYLYAKKLIEQDKIGELLIIRNYNMCGNAGIRKMDTYETASGGIFYDMGTHSIDLARWFFGKEAKSVYADGRNIKFTDGSIDNATATVNFADNKKLLFYVSQTSSYGVIAESEFIGVDGIITLKNIDNKIYLSIKSKGYSEDIIFDEGQKVIEKTFNTQLTSFIESCRCNKLSSNSANIYDGIQAVKIADACKLSQQSKQVVEL